MCTDDDDDLSTGLLLVTSDVDLVECIHVRALIAGKGEARRLGDAQNSNASVISGAILEKMGIPREQWGNDSANVPLDVNLCAPEMNAVFFAVCDDNNIF